MTHAISRRGLLASILAAGAATAPVAATALGVLPPSAAGPPGEDPIFAAIAAHDAAWSAMWEVRPKYRNGRKTRKYLRAIERYHTARAALLDTLPTTRDGLAAALRFPMVDHYPMLD